MRPIIFRGKTENGEWIHGDLINRASGPKIGGSEITPCTWENPCGDTVYIEEFVNHKTIGQFTGLTDKNGKEIYEGDVMKSLMEEMPPYVVTFLDGSFKLIHKWGVWGLLSRYFDICDQYSYDAEIIGNIHDNPELLPQQSKAH